MHKTAYTVLIDRYYLSVGEFVVVVGLQIVDEIQW